MPQNQQFDAGEFRSLAIPYDTLSQALSNDVRLTADAVRSHDVMCTAGKIVKRPGTTAYPPVAGNATPGRCKRLMAITPIVNGSAYDFNGVTLIGSFLVGGVYKVYYLDRVTFVWTLISSVRDVNASTQPHEFATVKGYAYIKAFPGSSGDKYGTVRFDPITKHVDYWGMYAPTTPVTMVAFTTASHYSVTVNVGWQYAYTYVTRTGHEGSRSPTIVSAAAPSTANTGRFTDYCPKMTLTSPPSDTTLVPYINIYRTVDGGGTFYFVEQIANSGSTQTYEDKNYPDGGFTADPYPDIAFDTTRVAPSRTSNDPPPSGSADNGAITGSTAVQGYTPIANFAGRLWYGSGNIVFYSANEELTTGVPEEAFPSGLRGNFYRFNYPITNVAATSEALYIFTTNDVWWIRGSSKDTFQATLLYGDIGGVVGSPRAIAVADKSVLALTNDQRVVMLRGATRQFISDPITPDIDAAGHNVGEEFGLVRYAAQEKDLVILYLDSSPGAFRQWVYDFNQETPLWNPIWTADVCHLSSVPPTTYLASQSLMAQNYSGSGGNPSGLVTFDIRKTQAYNATYDYDWGAGNTITGFSIHFSPVRNPTGNHVNQLRLPAMVSTIEAVKLDYTAYTSDTTVLNWFIYLDGTTFTVPSGSSQPIDPPRRPQSTGYTTKWYMIDKSCERVRLNIVGSASNFNFELLTMAFIWSPDTSV